MNFGVPLAILLGFHLLGLVYLYRTLRLLGDGKVNVLLTTLCAIHAFAGLNFLWFSAGLLRFPYIAFSIVAIHHFIQYGRFGRGRDAVIVVLSFAAAIAFHSKGILIPLYCAAFALAAAVVLKVGSLRWIRSGRRSFSGMRQPILLAVLAIASAAWIFFSRFFQDEFSKRLNLDPLYQARFQLDTWTILLHSLFDRIMLGELALIRGEELRHERIVLGEIPNYAPLVVFGLCIGIVGYSIFRSRNTSFAWLAGAFLIGVNILAVGVSNRSFLVGASLAFEYRHYYELIFLLTLFGGIVVHRLRLVAPEARWFADARRAAWASMAISVLLIAHAFASYDAFVESTKRPLVFDHARKTRAYLLVLLGDLEKLGLRPGVTPARPVRFVDGSIPRYLNVLDFEFSRLSQLFATMDIRAEFVADPDAQYAATETGHVIALNQSRP